MAGSGLSLNPSFNHRVKPDSVSPEPGNLIFVLMLERYILKLTKYMSLITVKYRTEKLKAD